MSVQSFSCNIGKEFESDEDFFVKVRGLGVDINNVKAAIVHRPNTELVFKSKGSLVDFVLKAPSEWQVLSNISTEVKVTMSPRYGNGHADISDEMVKVYLSRFGVIKSYQRLTYSECPTVENGVRQISMELNKQLPSVMHFGKTGFLIKHRGQQIKCHKCGSLQHKFYECTIKICHKCYEQGHLINECPNEVVCVVCSEVGHIYKLCPKSFANKAKNDNGENVEVQPNISVQVTVDENTKAIQKDLGKTIEVSDVAEKSSVNESLPASENGTFINVAGQDKQLAELQSKEFSDSQMVVSSPGGDLFSDTPLMINESGDVSDIQNEQLGSQREDLESSLTDSSQEDVCSQEGENNWQTKTSSRAGRGRGNSRGNRTTAYQNSSFSKRQNYANSLKVTPTEPDTIQKMKKKDKKAKRNNSLF